MKNHQTRPDWNAQNPAQRTQRDKAKAKHQQKEQERRKDR